MDHFDEKFRPTASAFVAIYRPGPDAAEDSASSVPLFSEHTLTEGKISENCNTENLSASAAAANIISTENTSLDGSSGEVHDQENDVATQQIPDAKVTEAKSSESSVNDTSNDLAAVVDPRSDSSVTFDENGE